MKTTYPPANYAAFTKLHLVSIIIIIAAFANGLKAQTVGIGTNTPDLAYKLDIAGNTKVSNNLAVLNRVGIGGAGNASYKLYVENGSSYFEGNTTTTGSAGITGNATIGGTLGVTGATTIDDNFRVNGRAGIGGATNGSYQLFVHGGHSYFDGNTTTTGSAAVTGNATIGGTVGITGATTVDDNFRVNGRAGIGGATNASYQLIVRGGNSYFESNATVAGTLNASGDLTIKGNGHVRTNGSSNLKVGFNQVSINTVVNSHGYVDVSANITPFTGDNDDVRVYVCQFVTTYQSSATFHYIQFLAVGVNADTDTCTIRLINQTGSAIVLVGTLYLMSVAKDN
jgi:hypothetical protein